MIRVGTRLYGFCGGVFGRESYEDKRVEAIGVDWVVARDENGVVWLYEGDPERLMEYSTKEEEAWPSA